MKNGNEAMTPSPTPAPPTEEGPYKVEPYKGDYRVVFPNGDYIDNQYEGWCRSYAFNLNLAHAAGRASASAEIAELRGALEKLGKCRSCGGSGKFWPAPWNLRIPQETCSVCNGDGLDKIARQALSRPSPPGSR